MLITLTNLSKSDNIVITDRAAKMNGVITMQIDDIGYNHRHERGFVIDRPNGTGDWLLLVIKSPCVFRLNGKDQKFPANTVVIFSPDQPQFYRADCDEYFDDWLHFWPSDEETALIEQLGITKNAPFELSDTSSLSSIVRSMCYEHYSPNPNKKEINDLYFRILLYKINEKLSRRSDSSKASEGVYFEKLLWIRESIYRWPSRDYTVDDMAKDLSLSRSRFQHLYSDTFGTSVTKDIISSRLSKASELLRTTDTPIKEIALLIGYGHNTSYFVKLFGSIYGMSPGQYRKNNSVIEKKENSQ